MPETGPTLGRTIDELQVMLAHHEKTIDELSTQLAYQWKTIVDLESRLGILTRRFVTIEENTLSAPEITKPPHY